MSTLTNPIDIVNVLSAGFPAKTKKSSRLKLTLELGDLLMLHEHAGSGEPGAAKAGDEFDKRFWRLPSLCPRGWVWADRVLFVSSGRKGSYRMFRMGSDDRDVYALGHSPFGHRTRLLLGPVDEVERKLASGK